MITHIALAGYLYPNLYRSRCPRFHKCNVSQKCQNYDSNLYECVVCESLVTPNHHKGGILAEGEFIPDLQYHDKVIRDALKVPYAHPDQESQRVGLDITLEYEKVRKSSEVLAKFMSSSNIKLEEETVLASITPELRHMLGAAQ